MTAPASVSAVDLGTLAVLLNVRSGQVEALVGPARQAWTALAHHSDVAAAAVHCGLDPDEVAALATELVHLKLLRTVPAPRPWPAPITTTTPSEPSWGSRTVAVRLNPLPPPTTTRPRLLAALALALVLATRDTGRAGHAFGRLVQLAAWSTRRARWPTTAAEATEAVFAVRQAARYWPARVACLEESISATVLLGLRRRRVTWCHGVSADPIHLHAWLEIDGQPIAEPESTGYYTPLLRIPPTRPHREDEHGRA